MVKAADIGSLIVLTPDIRGGRPRISGTGVTVRRIVEWYKLGLSPEEIAHEIGHITLAQVFAALAYYHANREEIEADLPMKRPSQTSWKPLRVEPVIKAREDQALP